jgi:signal transduction histidine kinase
MEGGKPAELQRLVDDVVVNQEVAYAALLDAEGSVVASAGRGPWHSLVALPSSVSDIHQVTSSVLTVAQPIVTRDLKGGDGGLAGAVRVVLDTAVTSASLARVQRDVTVLAVVIVLAVIPLGYFLVWRVLLQPMRRLVSATRRLAEGDFSARCRIRRNDEVGELGAAFDAMAGEVQAARQALAAANVSLERKVAERTEDLELANRRLQEEIAEKDEFVRAVSHDLNAPLRNIAGMAAMAMAKSRDSLPEDLLARLKRIQANVDAEKSLISELLELSRIRTRPERRRIVNMRQLLDGVKETFHFELKSRRIDLRIGEGMPTICVEKNRIREVFQNLIDNAIKYMHREKGGSIAVDYSFVDGFHQFAVSDNGPGIPKNEHRRIFCVFRRGVRRAARWVDGKGVGLALVKSVVANYDGRTWVESEVGQGTTFYVALNGRCTTPPSEEAFCQRQEAVGQHRPDCRLVG